MRVLIVGWASFLHGEATAGDVLAMRHVRHVLEREGTECDSAWSPAYEPAGPSLEDLDPDRYSHLVFVCGPLHGSQVRDLHGRFARCRRIAIGVSVVDPADAAVTGFHVVLPRDSGNGPPTADLALDAPTVGTPVVGVALASAQPEYGTHSSHEYVHARLTAWLGELDCARVPLDTRLDTNDWSRCATPDQLSSLIARVDMVVTTRLHGLVFGLRERVPVLAVDPVRGGGKVTAQAHALGWPATVPAVEAADTGLLTGWWRWCLSSSGKARARGCPDAVTPELGARLPAALGISENGVRSA